MELIYNRVDPEADIIFGTTTDNELDVDEVKITIVATGFDEAKNEAVLKKNSIPRRPVKEERKKSSTTSKSSPFTARNATTSSHKTTQTPKSTPQPEPKPQPQPEEPKKEEQKIDLVELFRQELKNIDLDDDFDTPTVFRH
jgi:cell division protein FtsZ